MTLTPKTKLMKLIDAYPFLLDFMAAYHPRFEILKNKAMRLTVGRMATLRKIAEIGGVPLNQLMADIARQIQAQTGEAIAVEGADSGPEPDRVAALKEIIGDLHRGATPASVKQRFDDLLGDAAPTEIAAMEEALIREGLAVTEIQRLCDVHVGVFKDSLDDGEEIQQPAGHPVHTFMAENAQLACLADELTARINALDRRPDTADLAKFLQDFGAFDKHYLRKEYQLFPHLEKHDISGPPKVMWAVHDEIRAQYKTLVAAAKSGEVATLKAAGPKFAREVVEMIYKENKILFPLCLATLDEAEWLAIHRGEPEIGFAFVERGSEWPPAPMPVASAAADGELGLHIGRMSLEQLNLMLNHLPVELSFVNENDEVRFYSDPKDRIFTRSPGVIGRKVQNCHPPKSAHLVQRILDAFRVGEKDVAEFWIDSQGRFLHIRYLAVRDAAGRYRGTLEVVQDVTAIRALQGEQRLLNWPG